MILLKESLFKHFIIFSSIAFIFTGTVLGILVSSHIRNDQIKNIEELTSLTIDTIIKPEMSPQDLKKPFGESINQAMDKKFGQIMSSNNILEVNIWSKEGSLVYSTNHFDKSEFNNVNNILSEVLHSGKSSYIVTRLERPSVTVSKNSKVIKVYVPIFYNMELSGLFEVYFPYDVIKQHMTVLNRVIFLVMFSGLLILYLFLLKTIFTASKTLIQQNRSLQAQNDELQNAYSKLNYSYKNTMSALSNAVDARDPYTSGHSERVATISLEIGKRLGLNEETLEKLEIAALFHDIGKLGIPDNILLKPGKLDEIEFGKIKEHPSIGVNILKNIDFLKDAIPIILHHHEKYSGNGYPDGIIGNDIPLEARIICVADTYDAITSDRPYRKGMSHEDAIVEITKFKGIQFDPEIVDSLLSICAMPILWK